MGWNEEKIATEQFKTFAKGIIRSGMANTRPYNNEVALYQYWKNVCEENNYQYHGSTLFKAERVLSSYNQQKVQPVEGVERILMKEEEPETIEELIVA